MNPRGPMYRCWSYCRTKHLVPLNWSFYRKRYGFINGIKDWRRRRRAAATHGYRAMYFEDCDARLRELVRLDPWEAAYLILAAVRARKAIVEIGRRWGGSTLVLAHANRNVPIYSIDIAPKDDQRLRGLFDEHEVGANVHLLVGDSQHGEFAEIESESFDLLFVDGDHSYGGCLADLEHWWPGLAAGGSALLHDCYQGSEVQDAAETFFEHHPARLLRPPNVPAAHWLTVEGSLAHAVKI